MSKERRPKTKEERVRSERQRLSKQYKGLGPQKLALAIGLIERAAFARVECEDLEADLREHGWTEPFQQAKGMDPYDRARPQGQAYQSLISNYQKIVRQLNAMLPAGAPEAVDDGFDEFVSGRDAP